MVRSASKSMVLTISSKSIELEPTKPVAQARVPEPLDRRKVLADPSALGQV